MSLKGRYQPIYLPFWRFYQHLAAWVEKVIDEYNPQQ